MREKWKEGERAAAVRPFASISLSLWPGGHWIERKEEDEKTSPHSLARLKKTREQSDKPSFGCGHGEERWREREKQVFSLKRRRRREGGKRQKRRRENERFLFLIMRFSGNEAATGSANQNGRRREKRVKLILLLYSPSFLSAKKYDSPTVFYRSFRFPPPAFSRSRRDTTVGGSQRGFFRETHSPLSSFPRLEREGERKGNSLKILVRSFVRAEREGGRIKANLYPGYFCPSRSRFFVKCHLFKSRKPKEGGRPPSLPLLILFGVTCCSILHSHNPTSRSMSRNVCCLSSKGETWQLGFSQDDNFVAHTNERGGSRGRRRGGSVPVRTDPKNYAHIERRTGTGLLARWTLRITQEEKLEKIGRKTCLCANAVYGPFFSMTGD